MQFFNQCIITQPPVVTSIEWNITILSKISWWSIDKLCFLFCDYFMHSFGSLFTDFFSIGVELSFFTIMQTLHCIIKSPFRLYNIWIHLEKQTWFSLNKYQSNNGTGCCSCSSLNLSKAVFISIRTWPHCFEHAYKSWVNVGNTMNWSK